MDEYEHMAIGRSVDFDFPDEWERSVFASLWVCAVEAHVFGRPDREDSSLPLLHEAVREHVEHPEGRAWVEDLVSRYPDAQRRQVAGWIDAGCPDTIGVGH